MGSITEEELKIDIQKKEKKRLKALDKKQKTNKVSKYFNKLINTLRDEYYKPLLAYFLKKIHVGILFSLI